LQVDTLASSTAMIRAASRAGFAHEGTLRQAAWVNGEFADEVVLVICTAAACGTGQPASPGRPVRLLARGCRGFRAHYPFQGHQLELRSENFMIAKTFIGHSTEKSS
jgi:hypothetical protein